MGIRPSQIAVITELALGPLLTDTNQGCWLLVWFITESKITLMPQAWPIEILKKSSRVPLDHHSTHHVVWGG